MTRIREGYVNDMTREKNRIHHALDTCGIKLSAVLSDLFGKTGQLILNGLLEGRAIDDILESINLKRIKSTAKEIKEAIKGSFEFTQILLIRGSLEQMSAIQKRINELQNEIKSRIAYRKEDLRIAMSIPGVGFTSAATLLAEIGDITDFKKPEQLAAWAGLVPSVYQSAGKLITGSITKHGSRHIRWILVQVARVIARGRNSRLKRFYLRVKAKKGSNVAVVALARKVLCILHHLLTNREMFKEDGINKKVKIAIEEESIQKNMDLDEMIAYIVRAGYEVRKGLSGGG